MKKAVHFGAGSIGRGFIGDLLHDTGYEIVLVDIDKNIVEQINKTNSYDLYIIEENYKKKTITNVKAVLLTDTGKIADEITGADLVTVSVWVDNLPGVAVPLLEGLKKRYGKNAERLNVLTCENAIHNGSILRNEVLKLDAAFTENMLDKTAAFPDTAVERMVLASERNGVRSVDIGLEHELVIEKTKLADPESKPVKGAVYTENMDKYIERKLFIINGGHAWAGYMGHVSGFTTMQEVFQNETFTSSVKEVMQEIGTLIAQKYNFSTKELDDYIDFVINRFKTPGITDYISRVSRNPIRKLKAGERLTGPCVQCEERGLKNNRLIQGIAAAFLYDMPEDQQSVELQAHIKEHGIEESVSFYTSIPAGSELHQKIVENYKILSEKKKLSGNVSAGGIL
ncbi:mannitol dehydrogenase [Sebaldella sp. S0638]|uniref:mannitol dehydrogenase family protein n=1 Tax=Sebaldella sp. S0638 TaxID=2957809 RepID=UPI00209CF2AF|nr:mannitol dehydrogenase [Sebaldella sp. S0638]MCP1224201.1 mannitol dehydrogenase [Sebaldella sp. S0638]